MTEDTKAKIDEAKAKGKVALNNASEKAKSVFSEIKTNFKADEGTEGVKKYKSMFANLWKSGTTGKATLVAASIVVLLLFKSIFFGGSSDGGFDSSKSVDVDTLVMKGLYMRQPGDEALKACKKIVSSSKNLVVVDFRNGIEHEKDEATKAAEKKEYEKTVAEAKEDVESFFKWQEYGNSGPVKTSSYGEGGLIRGRYVISGSIFMLAANFNYQVEWRALVKTPGGNKYETGTLTVPKKSEEEVMHFLYESMASVATFKKSIVYKQIKEKGLEMTDKDPQFRLASKNAKGDVVTKEDVAKNWLVACANHPPSDKMVIAKKNLIEIAIREDGKREDELKGICFVWINDEGKVKDIFFNEKGMARIFNAGDLSTDEFAEALVNNYSGDIPSLTADDRTEAATDDLLASMKTRTWIYKDPRGYQVKLLERDFYDVVGQKVKLREDLALALALKADKTRDKFFTVFAIKPESARKFD